MENISYIGLSQQVALKSMMDASANNIANMSTPGFKGQRVMFIDYLNKGKGAAPEDTIHQVQDLASYRDTGQGSLQITSNPLDVALQGDGYFAVSTGEGTAYTRNGSFSLNGIGELVDKMGNKVQAIGGQPIVIPTEAKHITITQDGMVSTEQGEIAQLKVAAFDNQQVMNERGDGLYTAAAGSEQPVEKLHVVQGSVESSNVNPILEMNRMVEVLRAYQNTAKMLQTDHERIRGAIQKLTRT